MRFGKEGKRQKSCLSLPWSLRRTLLPFAVAHQAVEIGIKTEPLSMPTTPTTVVVRPVCKTVATIRLLGAVTQESNEKMGLQSFVYNALFKRTSTFLVTIIATSIVFERGFDMASDQIFERINKGRLWKDIKHKYEKDE